jgi:rubrerythrin
MTPYHALELALRNEERAEAFFRNAGAGLKDARLRKLAAEIADEEADHVRLIRQWLAKYNKPAADWADDPDPSVYSE